MKVNMKAWELKKLFKELNIKAEVADHGTYCIVNGNGRIINACLRNLGRRIA